MAKWIDYVWLDVEDAFETKEKFSSEKGIKDIGLNTITRVIVKYDIKTFETKEKVASKLNGKIYNEK